MRLESNRVLLRELDIKDAYGNYPKWLNDKDVCRYNSHGDQEYTLDMAKEYIEFVNSSNKHYVFAVIDKVKNLHIGNISLQNINKKNNNAEYAILIGEKNYWNGGYGFEASKLLISFGFKILNLHRLYCGTPITNKAMQKLAFKLGFKKEGIAKDAFFKDGKYYDVVLYGLINGYA